MQHAEGTFTTHLYPGLLSIHYVFFKPFVTYVKLLSLHCFAQTTLFHNDFKMMM